MSTKMPPIPKAMAAPAPTPRLLPIVFSGPTVSWSTYRFSRSISSLISDVAFFGSTIAVKLSAARRDQVRRAGLRDEAVGSVTDFGFAEHDPLAARDDGRQAGEDAAGRHASEEG